MQYSRNDSDSSSLCLRILQNLILQIFFPGMRPAFCEQVLGQVDQQDVTSGGEVCICRTLRKSCKKRNPQETCFLFKKQIFLTHFKIFYKMWTQESLLFQQVIIIFTFGSYQALFLMPSLLSSNSLHTLQPLHRESSVTSSFHINVQITPPQKDLVHLKNSIRITKS